MDETVAARFRPLVGFRPIEASLPLRWRLGGSALLGGIAASLVGYLASQDPAAAPQHVAVLVRVLIITMFIGAGIYAQTSRVQARMGALLVAAGLFSAVWLLNGSARSFPFTVGLLASGLVLPMFAYVMLAQPSGGLENQTERRFVVAGGGLLVLVWTLLLLTSPQPPFSTPLLRCVPHCPRNLISLGSVPGGVTTVLKVIAWLSWAALACGTPYLLVRRMRSASAPMRRALVPVAFAAAVDAILWVGFFIARSAGHSSASALGAAYVEVVAAVPAAILCGLALERLFMGRELAGFINQLMQTPHADPRDLMAGALDDSSLTIAYRRPTRGTYVDSSGTPVFVPNQDPDRLVVWIERDRRPIAAVICDAKLADQERFVQAAGAAAMMCLEGGQLEAELVASSRELAASRARLAGAALAERQRIERDLHDGVQQQLVGLRIKLEMAAEALKEEPSRGEGMIATIGHQMDDLLATVRSLARGIYPALLSEQGVAAALRSSARAAPLRITMRARGVGRYRREVEVAVYFSCLEAIQNIAKHAGEREGVLRLWDEDQQLQFEVSDSGSGFDPGEVNQNGGLINMRDRIEAVGGTLRVASRKGRGTSIRGRVPVS